MQELVAERRKDCFWRQYKQNVRHSENELIPYRLLVWSLIIRYNHRWIWLDDNAPILLNHCPTIPFMKENMDALGQKKCIIICIWMCWKSHITLRETRYSYLFWVSIISVPRLTLYKFLWTSFIHFNLRNGRGNWLHFYNYM